jgi:predicted phage terminase large subunit-like protein
MRLKTKDNWGRGSSRATPGKVRLVGEPLRIHSHLCRRRLFHFVQMFWPVIVPEDAIWNWHIEYLCEELQKLAENVFMGVPREHDLIINIPPGTSKSTICSIMFPTWIWTRMPTARIICASYSNDIAFDNSTKSRDLITSDLYRSYFPEIMLRQDQKNKGHWRNEHGGARYSRGVGSAFTGRHAHFQIVDDPLNPKQAASLPDLKKVNDFMDRTLPTRKVEKRVTPLILIQQRLHQDDPSGHRLANPKKGKVRQICLPATTEYPVKPKALKDRYTSIEGEEFAYLDPVRLGPEANEEAKADGEYAYSGQFGQRPVPPGGGMFKVGKLNYGPPPHFNHWEKVVRYWDKAGSHNQGCYTVGALLAIDKDGRLWVLDIVRGRWETWSREQEIQKTAKRDTPQVPIRMEQEPGSSGKDSVWLSVSNLHGFRVSGETASGDKSLRAEPFASQVNGGNVWLPAGADWIPEYVEELTYFPFSSTKDQVDASSGAYKYLSEKRLRLTSL